MNQNDNQSILKFSNVFGLMLEILPAVFCVENQESLNAYR
jgi:hypothetical protein